MEPANAARPARQPTAWTRPLQYAVGAWAAVAAVYTGTIPFWMAGTMTQAINQSIQRRQSTGFATPPPGFADTMTSMLNITLWVAALFGLAIYAVAIAGAIWRWNWVYYAVLVLLGLGLVSLPVNVANAATGGSINAAEGFSLPAQMLWLSIAFGLAGGALFVWMLIALVRRGPWAMRRVA